MRNLFAYLQLPASSNTQTVQARLAEVPDEEFDMHHVLSNETTLTHYRRVHQQCNAMAVLLSTMSDESAVLNTAQWHQRLGEFDVEDDQID